MGALFHIAGLHFELTVSPFCYAVRAQAQSLRNDVSQRDKRLQLADANSSKTEVSAPSPAVIL